jgi:photosystem II stability/assembly factor-like uncharacterized protein
MPEPIFTNKNTSTWIQQNGVGTSFSLLSCHALVSWSQDFDDPVFVKCKSADEYGKKVTVATIPGDENEPTLTVNAYTNRELDVIIEQDCPTDYQVQMGTCSSPSDPTGFTKIRHFYQVVKNTQGEENLDFIGDEDFGPLELSGDFTAEAIVTVLQVAADSSNNGVTETQGFNDIAMLEDGRCEGDCGARIADCAWGVAVSNADYGAATADVWITTDGGASWSNTTTDPFSDNNANISSCVILPGEVAPRIVVSRGNVSTSYGTRFSVSDDWGETWTEVAAGGTTGGTYVNAMYKFSSGFLWAVGNGGNIYYSQDSGNSWTQITSTTTGVIVELWDIDSSDGQILYAVGDDNTVIFTTNQGTSWSATSASPAAGTENLYTVQVHSQYRVLVGGQIDANEEVLWVTEDSGASWTAQTFTGSTTASGSVRRLRSTRQAIKNHMILIHGVESVSTRYGAGTNHRFYRTLDGGATWVRENLVTNSGLNGLYVCNVNVALAAGQPVGGVAEIQKLTFT